METRMWKLLRNKDIPREMRYFMWMTMHDVYIVGDKWLQSNFSNKIKERSKCKHCNRAEESMNHVLTECCTLGQEETWELAKNLWRRINPKDNWPTITLGLILGIQCTEIRSKTGDIQSRKTRLFKILVGTTTHLIWKLRCQRVIQDENRPKRTREIEQKWIHMIDDCITLYYKITNWKGMAGKP
jgi:hypothetical protein